MQDLKQSKKIESFSKPASLDAVRAEFNRGSCFFEDAKKAALQKFDTEFVYKNIYDAIRKMCDSVLKSEGYRAKGKDHHKTIIKAVQIILSQPNLNEKFIRLQKMSTNRNKIDYGIFTSSSSDLEQAMTDGEEIRQVLEKYLSKKAGQEGLKI
ncbi:hypothetical protein ACFLZC_01305 [Patescibacteria group bacterium]